MADDDRASRILARVLELTRAGALEWTEMEGGFEVAFEAATIRSRSVDNDGIAPFVFEIHVQGGSEPIAELRTAGMSPLLALEERQARAAQNNALEQLYSLARRKVLGVDTILDRLEHELRMDAEA